MVCYDIAMASQPLDIVIFPPLNIINNAIDISNFLTGKGYFTLDEEGPYPHISLYQAEFPVENLEMIKSRLHNIAKSQKHFSIKPPPEPYKKEDKDFIEVSYEKSGELYQLQREILESLNPLRNGLLRTRDKERYNQLSREQRENLDNWGYRSVGNEFRPHLTLTRLKNPDSISGHNLPKKEFSFRVSQIGIFHLEEYGTCIKKVAIYDLLD
jgi:2'-5' RNA ligase